MGEKKIRTENAGIGQFAYDHPRPPLAIRFRVPVPKKLDFQKKS